MKKICFNCAYSKVGGNNKRMGRYLYCTQYNEGTGKYCNCGNFEPSRLKAIINRLKLKVK